VELSTLSEMTETLFCDELLERDGCCGFTGAERFVAVPMQIIPSKCESEVCFHHYLTVISESLYLKIDHITMRMWES
jgi:hypothetical protein